MQESRVLQVPGFCMSFGRLSVVLGHVVQRVPAALKHQQVERDPVCARDIAQILEQGFGEPDGARNVGVSEVSFQAKQQFYIPPNSDKINAVKSIYYRGEK